MRFHIAIIVLIYVIIYVFNYQSIERFASTYKSACGIFPELLEQVMKKRNMRQDDENYDFYIPCSYNNAETDILEFEKEPNSKKLYMIDGCDQLASKLAIWEDLKLEFGSDASKYMPMTYLLEDKNDMADFPKHFEENKKKRDDQMYVLKNFAQRQEGIKITRDLDYIMEGLKHGWYLVQDYIYNPYIIDKRKINLRYYLLITCIDGEISGYIHKNGFLYYTPEYYDEHSLDFDKHVTTGYIDRAVYEKNPLTLDDFRKHIDKRGNNASTKWNKNVEYLMHQVMQALSKKICKNDKLKHHVRFELFGCDVAPSDTLDAILIEVNKGPDMNAKDERDKQVKLEVQEDMLKIIEPFYDGEENKTRFVKIF